MFISSWETSEKIHEKSIIRKYDLSVYFKISKSEIEKIHRYLKKNRNNEHILDESSCIFVKFTIIIIVYYIIINQYNIQ